MSWLRVCLSAEGAKNVSWPWLSSLRGWSSLTVAFIVNLHIYFRVHPYNICGEASAHLYGKEQSF